MMLCKQAKKANSLCSCAVIHVLAYDTQQSESSVVNADLLAVSGSGVAGHADVCGQAWCTLTDGKQDHRMLLHAVG